MTLSIDGELEARVSDEVRAGRFESADALLATALRHYLIARDYGEAEANKLATLREELGRADAQIDAGDCSEYDSEALSSLFDETRREALVRLNRRSNP